VREPRSAHEILGVVLDRGSFESWDTAIDISQYDAGYRAELQDAARRAGTDESVITGQGLVHGHRVAVIANEFAFLAGSIGRDAAGRIVEAVRRATAERLPLLARTSSGGTRMQEGTPAFIRMTEISRAIAMHRAAGLPYLVYLGHPTTGGVLASWGSLGHVTLAEPGALVGFLGPRVFEALNGRPFLSGVQTSESLATAGIVDGVVPVDELADLVARALRVVSAPAVEPTLLRRTLGESSVRPIWDSILETRRVDRAGVRELLAFGCTDTVRLSGTQEGERESSVLLALTRLDGQPCVLVGQDRSRQAPGHAMGPAGLREARRGMRLAEELRLPLVTIIDTPGADLSPNAERKALAGEIARCTSELVSMTVPSVSVLLGQGCGGGALSLFPAQVRLAAEHSWLSPLPPEGASAILYGETSRAAEMAEAQRISARHLLSIGAIDGLVPEHEGDSPEALAQAVCAEVGAALHDQRVREWTDCVASSPPPAAS
jgi:acetyl-CoA carboxylase beta subunit